MIVVLHWGGSNGWKLAVEFFFITSGLLMAYDFDIKEIGYLQYIRKRILRLWPHYIYSFIVFIAVSAIISGEGYEFVIAELQRSALEVLMLQIIGIGYFATNHGAVWYVSALVVASIFLYGILRLIRKNRRKRDMLCIAFIMGGWCSQFIFGQLCIVTYDSKWGLCLIPGLIRGISEMAVGIECYYFGKWMKSKKIFDKYRKSLVFIEVLVMMSVTIYTRENLKNYVFIIMAYACAIIISYFVEHGLFFWMFNRWERYTYAIYLNHPIILILLKERPLWMVLTVVTVYSIITTMIFDRLKEISNRNIMGGNIA